MMKHQDHPFSPPRPDRRTFLRSAVTIGAGLALPSSLVGCAGGYDHDESEPLLDVTLTATQDPANDQLYFYNGLTPGPTLRVRRGKKGGQLKVKLVNAMDPNPNGDADNCPANHNILHGSRTTNLHTHGLHVSPTKDRTGVFDADNIFISVFPEGDPEPSCAMDESEDGKSLFKRGMNQFVFDIPADHPPGTHWYHAHKHGSTARQVGGGLAGALIIEEEDWDGLPSYIANAEEQVFMIQKLPPTFELTIIRVDEAGGGERKPTITMRPGEVRRWRFINGSPAADAFVTLTGDPDGIELYQIAFDGLTLPKRLPIDLTDTRPPAENPFALAPGNRTDLLIRAPLDAAGQRYAFNVAPYDGGIMEGARVFRAAELAVLEVVVEGEPLESEWSDDDALPGPGLEAIGDEEIAGSRTIAFDGFNTIDGEAFTGEIEQTMALGTAEEWTILEQTDFSHPFHIHVNPFYVTHIDGVELESEDPRRRWQDTIALPKSQSVTFRTRFVDFAGKFVIHCHVLIHEDMGMMQAVQVVDPATS